MRPEVKMEQGLYELTRLIHPQPASGAMICVTDSERAGALELVQQFVKFVDPNTPELTTFSEKLADRHISRGNLYVWKDKGACVALAVKVRETPNGASISMVITPSEHRGRGYASNLVAHLCQHLLSQGKQMCNLFTDWSNRRQIRSRRIGFERLDAVSLQSGSDGSG